MFFLAALQRRPLQVAADCALAWAICTLRSARTHHPPTVPVSLQPLLCGSCSCCPCLALALWHVKTRHVRTPGAQRCPNVAPSDYSAQRFNRCLAVLWHLPAQYHSNRFAFVHWLPTYPGQLAPTTLPRVALLLPLSCPGFLARKDVSCLCSGGAKASHCFPIKLVSSMLQWPPTHLGQLEPTTLPQ